jgi:hypothetical protein
VSIADALAGEGHDELARLRRLHTEKVIAAEELHITQARLLG